MEDTAISSNIAARLTPVVSELRQAVTSASAPLLVFDRQGGHFYLMARLDPYAATEAERQKFSRLAREWRKDILLSSSVTQDHMHPSHLAILAMGKPALPLILEELQQNGGHWFLALRLISDTNPVPPEHAGRLKLMREDWIEWGRQHGYL
ncbi:MAG TPA: hypothetical protein VFS76_14005 [Pyrinomonadaceae bacterium]|nr:hypothetical protein [Pyrinomonadaceae bacterium]